jgi:predicted 2-oxoglutarate/Fe(II)-dependent dioxygenase YbiX
METGSFIGLHLDQDSNPDYLVAIVIQFGEKYEGGEFVLKREEAESISYKPQKHTTIISDCSIPHEVTRITKGNRKSLVYFLSKHEGLNRRYKK